jgi:hypothetical protein
MQLMFSFNPAILISHSASAAILGDDSINDAAQGGQ